MKIAYLFAAAAAIVAVPATAQIAVDGTRDAAYGAAKSSVTYLPGAPESNFGAPTPFSDAVGYDIYLTSDFNKLYGFFQARPDLGGASIGAFANLYFDLDPANNNGSDLGFEINNQRAFLPGLSGYASNLDISYAIGGGGNTLEFSIPVAYFTDRIAGLNYDQDPDYAVQQFVSASNPNTVLRLSQAFGYSVAGGATYGNDRLGSTALVNAGAVPEPASWALMIGGCGLVGGALRRRGNVRSTGVRFA